MYMVLFAFVVTMRDVADDGLSVTLWPNRTRSRSISFSAIVLVVDRSSFTLCLVGFQILHYVDKLWRWVTWDYHPLHAKNCICEFANIQCVETDTSCYVSDESNRNPYATLSISNLWNDSSNDFYSPIFDLSSFQLLRNFIVGSRSSLINPTWCSIDRVLVSKKHLIGLICHNVQQYLIGTL